MPPPDLPEVLSQSPDGFWDVQVVLPDRPGMLASVMEALDRAGLPLAGFNAFTGSGTAILHLCTPAPEATRLALRDVDVRVGRALPVRLVNLPHRQGALGDLGTALERANVNVTVCYLTSDPAAGTRMVLGVEETS